MPIVLIKEQLTLVCLNAYTGGLQDGGLTEHQMVRSTNAVKVEYVQTPLKKGESLLPTGFVKPMIPFWCKACGYIEFYQADVADRAWVVLPEGT